MINIIGYKVVGYRVVTTRAENVPLMLTAGQWIVEAETAQCYFKQTDDLAYAFATDGRVVPRDDRREFFVDPDLRSVICYLAPLATMRFYQVEKI